MGRRWRRFLFGCALAVAVSGLTMYAVNSVDIPFELDGNAVVDNGAYDDWWTVNATGGASIVHTGVVPDMHTAPPDPTAFFNKQTKDTVDIPGNWTYKATSVPDKDDIDNAYAAAYIPSTGARAGHTIFTFGADRFSAGNGTAFLGFWFFQDAVAPVAGSSNFSGKHVDGDLLILVNFSGGGSHPAVQVLEWAANQGDVATNLKELYNATDGLCDNGPTGKACAITNGANSIFVNWNFAYKGQATCTSGNCEVPPLAFFEGAVDLTDLFGENIPCITSFLAETRSSDSVTADLKDFVAKEFQLCKIGIAKACGTANPAGTTVDYTNGVTVQNQGSGTLYNAVVTDTYPTGKDAGGNPITGTRYFAADCTGLSPCTVVPGLGTLAKGASVSFNESFSIALISATDSVSVAAAPVSTAGAVKTVKAGPSSATCELAVEGSVIATKSCKKTELVVDGGVLKVAVTVEGTITNNSTKDTDIQILTVTDSKGGALTPAVSVLQPTETTTFGPFTYYPTAVDYATCSAGSNCFYDEVTVAWKTIITDKAGAAAKASATCALCPTCPAPCASSTSTVMLKR